MSYCVNCGVELDDTAAFCPLCHTPVHNPNQPVNQTAPKPFPTERKEVPPASKLQVAILLSTILASVAVCCGVLNVFLRTQRTWSLYVIGAALMIWIWTVPPLLHHRKDMPADPVSRVLILQVRTVQNTRNPAFLNILVYFFSF